MIMILIENDNFFILQKIKAPIFSISALIKKYQYKNLVRLEGLEPPSSDFVGLHSIQLNYSRIYNYYKIILIRLQSL